MLMMEGKGFFRGIWREREEQEQHLQEDLVVTVPRGPLLKSGPSPAGTAPQCCVPRPGCWMLEVFSFTCSTSVCTSVKLSKERERPSEWKGWLSGSSSSCPGAQSGYILLPPPPSRHPKTWKSDSSSESLCCLQPLTPPFPSALSPSRVKMKSTVSVSVRDGRMEVRKSSWEKEKWGPWGRKRGENPSHEKLWHTDLETKEALRGH